MADLTKPAEMSDVLWAAIEDDFNGEDPHGHRPYFTLGEVGIVVAPTQEDLDNWHATIVAIEVPDATTAEEVTHHALNSEEESEE